VEQMRVRRGRKEKGVEDEVENRKERKGWRR